MDLIRQPSTIATNIATNISDFPTTLQFERHRCSLCSSQFSRPEHLQRHINSHHIHGKVHTCGICSKSFNHSDVLQRHVHVHNVQDDSGSSNSFNQTRARVHKACLGCATARTKCTGTLPCTRCHNKQTKCTYARNQLVFAEEQEQEEEEEEEKEEAEEEEAAHQSGYPEPRKNDNASNYNMGFAGGYVENAAEAYEIANTVLPLQTVNQNYSAVEQTVQPEITEEMSNMFNLDYLLPINWLELAEIQEPPSMASFLDRAGAITPSFHHQSTNLFHSNGRDASVQASSDLAPGTYSPASSSSHHPSEISRNSSDIRSSRNVPTRAGKRYVDSEDGGRESWVGTKRRRTQGKDDVYRLEEQQNIFPDTSTVEVNTTVVYISSNDHDNLMLYLDDLCSIPFMEPFDKANFPSFSVMNHLINLYFENMTTIIPVLHEHNTKFDNISLYLAVSSIGSQFSDNQLLRQCTQPLKTLLQRCIKINDIQEQDIPLNLAILFHIIMLFSGTKKDQDYILNNHGKLVEKSKRLNFKSTIDRTFGGQDWQSWIRNESQIRSFYTTWLLDAMITYHFDRKSCMTIADADMPLPCLESVWNADSADSWANTYNDTNSSQTPSLQTALQRLYIEKEVDSHIGEFARILLIHGLHQETAIVADYVKRPLATWIPTHEKHLTPASETPVWLPSDPTYSKFRNAACDCLDVLHWMANSQIAIATSFEHPTVLHLHTARLVLLTPHHKIQNLLETGGTRAWEDVWRWRHTDQHKARLALIHAGVVFWHVRRFSANSLHEPNAVFLATLALWAYASLSGEQEARPRGDDDFDNLVRLDRPCDDELVQRFVREGDAVVACMTGVGNICSKEAPRKILKEGIKLLHTLDAWRCSISYASLLEHRIASLSSDSVVTATDTVPTINSKHDSRGV